MKILFLIFLIVSSSVAQNCKINDYVNQIEHETKKYLKMKQGLKHGLEKGILNEAEMLKFFGARYLQIEKKTYLAELKTNSIPANTSFDLKCLNTNQELEEKYNQLQSLQNDVNDLRIKYLKTNMALNTSTSLEQIKEVNLEFEQDKIDELTKEVQQKKEELESEVKESTRVESINDTVFEKNFTFIKKSLSLIQIEIVEYKLKLLNEISGTYDQLSKRFQVNSLLMKEINNKSNTNHEREFLDITSQWKEVIKENFYSLFSNNKLFNVPDIDLDKLNLEDLSNEQKNQAEIEIKNFKVFRSKVIDELKLHKEKEQILKNSYLIQVNNIRTELYAHLPSFYLFSRLENKSFYVSLRDEVVSSPYRLIAFAFSKFNYVRDKISLGYQGIKTLSLDIISFLFILIFFYVVKLLISKSKDGLDNLSSIVLKRIETQFIKKVVTSWHKYKSSYHYLIWGTVLFILEKLKLFTSVTFIFQFFYIYFAKKVIEVFVVLFLANISRVNVQTFREFKLKSHKTSTTFGNIYFYYFISMLLIEASIGKTYVYSLFNYFIVLYSVFRLLNEASLWTQEMHNYCEKNFSGMIIERIEKIYAKLPRKIESLLYFITIIFLSIIQVLINLLSHFEVSKKISANIFKKQIENLAVKNAGDSLLPQEYLDLFSPKSIDTFDFYISFDEKIENHFKEKIKQWFIGDSDEHYVFISGEKGVGKTTFLKKNLNDLQNEINQTQESEIQVEFQKIYTKVPSKSIDLEGFNLFLLNLFNQELDLDLSLEKRIDLFEIDKKLQKKVIIVLDEAQNIFLSQYQGFESFKFFIKILNYDVSNIYWVMAINKHSWSFLNKSLGSKLSIGNVLELNSWSDQNIKDLILTRHNSTNFKLSYDLLITATRSQDEIDKFTSVENKFFKLLWEVSSGNPRASILLWPTSLYAKPGTTTFVVSIPEQKKEELSKMNDEYCFLLASIMRHENLTLKEMESTLNSNMGVIRSCLKHGLDKGLIYRDERNRYMIDISFQYRIIRLLKSKNLIYG
ncbi:AAA family ATPase [Bacteriovoracaceae bacterium]|nr:AAA family ATPase [Bacteriovoracaceae bacterium]